MDSRKKNIFSWILRLVVSVIFLQTLFFKFTGAEESKMLFSALGVEPWGRIITGIAEFIAVVLLFYRRGTIKFGALVAMFLMVGAVLSHFFVLGIEVQNDNGLLFILAIIALVAALGVFVIHKDD